MNDRPYSFQLRQSHLRDGGIIGLYEQLGYLDALGTTFLGDVSDRIEGYREITRRHGGFWIATCGYRGTESELVRFFETGLGLDFRRVIGRRQAWRGFIADMELTIGRVAWRRSLVDITNAVRVLYSSIGDNLLTNGGGESGAWAGYNTPTTVETSTAWNTEGSVSVHIVAGAASKGATIQSGVSIEARKPYDLRVSCKIVSGVWLLSVIRTDNSESLAEVQSDEAGEVVLECSVGDDNEYAGTVNIRLETVDATGEIYADAAVFQRGPIRAETSWYHDLASQSEFGQIEAVLSRDAMTVEAAASLAQTYLRGHAWPRSLPPDSFEALEENLRGENVPASLSIIISGYWATLNWRHTTLSGTQEASTHVANLAAASQFVYAGTIQVNDMPFKVENEAGKEPPRIGDTLRAIAGAGAGADEDGTPWDVGVYEDLQLHYQEHPRELEYRWRNGVLYDLAGAVVKPWLARPGWVFLEDAPVGPSFASEELYDDLRWVFAEEVEFEEPDKLRFKSSAS